MTRTLEKLGWRPVYAAEDHVSPTGGEKNTSASGTPQRPIRIADDLWEDFGIVASAMDSDRSAMIRDYVRWSVYDDTAPYPDRPERKPDGLTYVEALPPEIEVRMEGDILPGTNKRRPRYVMRPIGEARAISEVLVEAEDWKGVSYQETDPTQFSTLDRAQARRILALLKDAGYDFI